jgi:GNAT superfamily N-acetyltransferase
VRAPSGRFGGEKASASLAAVSPATDAALLARLLRFELDLERDAAALVERHQWGSLVLAPQEPRLWSANYLEPKLADLDADSLSVLADRLLGERGYAHRYVHPAEPALGDRLAPGLLELGWEIDRSLYLVLRRDPDRRPRAVAEEMPRRRLAAVRRAVASGPPRERDPETVTQLLRHDARIDARARGRWFGATLEGRPAAACVLLERDGIGQVETVNTVLEARNRGLASAVILAAIEASRRAGHSLTFIVADADDWPWELYRRLGFDPVGVAAAFLRRPPGPAPSPSRRPRP